MTAAAGLVVARQVQSLHWPPFSAPSPGRGIPSVRLESNKNEYFSRHQEYLFINSNAIFRFGGRSPRHHGGTITTLGRSRDTTGFPPGKKSPSISTIPWTAVTSRNFLWVIFFFGGRPAVTHFIAFTKWPVVKSAQNYRLLVTWIQNSPTIIWLLFQQTADWL